MMQVCEKGIRFCLSTDTLFVSTMNFRICSPPIKESGWKRPYCGGADTLSYAFALGEDGKFGFYPLLTANAYELATQKYTLAEAIPAGIEMGIGQLGSYVKQLKLLFSQGDTAYKSVGGMASIANIFPGYWNWHSFWELTALISIMLAVVNILPIPALDGGHVLFLLYEVVTRRKPGREIYGVCSDYRHDFYLRLIYSG